jgi:hypothetical protein
MNCCDEYGKCTQGADCAARCCNQDCEQGRKCPPPAPAQEPVAWAEFDFRAQEFTGRTAATLAEVESVGLQCEWVPQMRPPAPAQPLTDELVFEDALRIALGCKDYGGGYRGNAEEYEIYQHGIQTVVNALRSAHIKGLKDSQVSALHQIGYEAAHGITKGNT